MLHFHFQALKHSEQIQLKVLKYKINNVITAIWDNQKSCILSRMGHLMNMISFVGASKCLYSLCLEREGFCFLNCNVVLI